MRKTYRKPLLSATCKIENWLPVAYTEGPRQAERTCSCHNRSRIALIRRGALCRHNLFTLHDLLSISLLRMYNLFFTSFSNLILLVVREQHFLSVLNVALIYKEQSIRTKLKWKVFQILMLMSCFVEIYSNV